MSQSFRKPVVPFALSFFLERSTHTLTHSFLFPRLTGAAPCVKHFLTLPQVSLHSARETCDTDFTFISPCPLECTLPEGRDCNSLISWRRRHVEVGVADLSLWKPTQMAPSLQRPSQGGGFPPRLQHFVDTAACVIHFCFCAVSWA